MEQIDLTPNYRLSKRQFEVRCVQSQSMYKLIVSKCIYERNTLEKFKVDSPKF